MFQYLLTTTYVKDVKHEAHHLRGWPEPKIMPEPRSVLRGRRLPLIHRTFSVRANIIIAEHNVAQNLCKRRSSLGGRAAFMVGAVR